MIQNRARSNSQFSYANIIGGNDINRSLQTENIKQSLGYLQKNLLFQDSNHINSQYKNYDNLVANQSTYQIDQNKYKYENKQLQLNEQNLLKQNSKDRNIFHQKSNSIDSFKLNSFNCILHQLPQKNSSSNNTYGQIINQLPPIPPIFQIQQQNNLKYSDSVLLSHPNNSLTTSQLRQSNFIEGNVPKIQNSCNFGNNISIKQNRSISDYNYQQNTNLTQVFPQAVLYNTFKNNNAKQYVISSPQNLSPPISNRMEYQNQEQKKYHQPEQQCQYINSKKQKNANTIIQSQGNQTINIIPNIIIQNKVIQNLPKTLQNHNSILNSNEAQQKISQLHVHKIPTIRKFSPSLQDYQAQKYNQQNILINSMKDFRSKSLATEPYIHSDRVRLIDDQLSGNLNNIKNKDSFISKLNLSNCQLQESLCQQKSERYNQIYNNNTYQNLSGAFSDRTHIYKDPVKQKDQKCSQDVSFYQEYVKQNQKNLNSQQVNFEIKINPFYAVEQKQACQNLNEQQQSINTQQIILSKSINTLPIHQNSKLQLNQNQQINQKSKNVYNQNQHQQSKSQILSVSAIHSSQQLDNQPFNLQKSIVQKGNQVQQNSYCNYQHQKQYSNEEYQYQIQNYINYRRQSDSKILISLQPKNPTTFDHQQLIQQNQKKDNQIENNFEIIIQKSQHLEQNNIKKDNNIAPKILNGDDLISLKYKTIKQKLNNLTNMSNELLNKSQIDINQRVEKMIEDQIAIRQNDILKQSQVQNENQLTENVNKIKIIIEKKKSSSPIDNIQQYMKRQNENSINQNLKSKIQSRVYSSPVKENQINHNLRKSKEEPDTSQKHIQLIQSKIDSIRSSLSKERQALYTHKTDSIQEQNQILQNHNMNHQSSSFKILQDKINNSLIKNQNSRRNSIQINESEQSLIKQEGQNNKEVSSSILSNDLLLKKSQQLNIQQPTQIIPQNNKTQFLNSTNKTYQITNDDKINKNLNNLKDEYTDQDKISIYSNKKSIPKNYKPNDEINGQKLINEKIMDHKSKDDQNSQTKNNQITIPENSQCQLIQNKDCSSPMQMDDFSSAYSPIQSNKKQGTNNTFQTGFSQNTSINNSNNNKKMIDNEQQNKVELIDSDNITSAKIYEQQTKINQQNYSIAENKKQFHKQFTEEVSQQYVQENSQQSCQQDNKINEQIKFIFTKNKTFNQTHDQQNIGNEKNQNNEPRKQSSQSIQQELNNDNLNQQNRKSSSDLPLEQNNNQKLVNSEEQSNTDQQQMSKLQTYLSDFQNKFKQKFSDQLSEFESQKTLQYVDEQGIVQPITVEQTQIRRQSSSDSNSQCTDISSIENQINQENILYENSIQKTRQLKDKLQNIRLDIGLDIEKYVEKLYQNLYQSGDLSQEQQKQIIKQIEDTSQNELSDIFNKNQEELSKISSKNTLNFTPSTSINSQQQFQKLKNHNIQNIENINQTIDIPSLKQKLPTELIDMQQDKQQNQIEENETFQQRLMKRVQKRSSFNDSDISNSNQQPQKYFQQNLEENSIQAVQQIPQQYHNKMQIIKQQIENLYIPYQLDQFDIHPDVQKQQSENCITQSFQTALTDNQQIDPKNIFLLNEQDQNNFEYLKRLNIPSQNDLKGFLQKNTETGLNSKINSKVENDEIGTRQTPFSKSSTISKQNDQVNNVRQSTQDAPEVIKSMSSSQYELSSDFSSYSQQKIDDFQNIKNCKTQNNEKQINFETSNLKHQGKNQEFLIENDQIQSTDQQRNSHQLINQQNFQNKQDSLNLNKNIQQDLEKLSLIDLQLFVTKYLQNINIQKKNYKKEYKIIKSQFQSIKQLLQSNQNLNSYNQQLLSQQEFYIKDIKIKINYIDLQKTDLDKKIFNCSNQKEIILNYLKISQLISKGIYKIINTFQKIQEIQQKSDKQPIDSQKNSNPPAEDVTQCHFLNNEEQQEIFDQKQLLDQTQQNILQEMKNKFDKIQVNNQQ